MYAFFFLQDRLYLNHMFIFKFTQNVHFLHESVALLQTYLVNLSYQHSRHLACTLLTLSERIVFLHRNYDLLGHSFPLKYNKIKTSFTHSLFKLYSLFDCIKASHDLLRLVEILFVFLLMKQNHLNQSK